jgi:membrane protease YdiL (CAAX protease family)
MNSLRNANGNTFGSFLNGKAFLTVELAAVFVVLPVLFGTRFLSTPLILIPLVLVCVPAIIWLGKTDGFVRTTFWSADPLQERQYLPVLLRRLAVAAILLLLYAVVFLPDSLFDLPRRAPGFLLLMIAGYTVLSVYPQEILFRAFFFRRYRPLFPHGHTMVLANTLLFCWMHVAFANFTAMWLTLVGGGFFAMTYRKTRSLRLVCLEHALYGAMLFTLGYGRFFFYNRHWLDALLR